MKITDVMHTEKPLVSEQETVSHTARGNTNFEDTLRYNQQAASKQYMEQLLDEITEQGKKLGQVPTYSELKKYRELVRDFVGEAVQRSYVVDSHAGWDHRGRQKIFTTVKQIDQEMGNLAELVRQGQSKSWAIMDRLDAIRGLLVDLYA